MAYDLIPYNGGLEIAGNGTALSRITSADLATLILTLTVQDEGKIFYQTDTNVYCYWDGTAIQVLPTTGASTDEQVIFNNLGVFDGDVGLRYTQSQAKLKVGSAIDIWKGQLQDSTSPLSAPLLWPLRLPVRLTTPPLDIGRCIVRRRVRTMWP